MTVATPLSGIATNDYPLGAVEVLDTSPGNPLPGIDGHAGGYGGGMPATGGVPACVCLSVDVVGSPDRLSPAHHAQRGADHRRTPLALRGGGAASAPLASLTSRAYF